MRAENINIPKQLTPREVALKIDKYLIDAREKLLNIVLTELIGTELNEKIAKQITRVTYTTEPGVETYYLNYGKKKEKFLLRFKYKYRLPTFGGDGPTNLCPTIEYSTPVPVKVNID